jgi:hypothetical protein
LGNMANSRTYVRLLRHLGIALIFAPEPFTTPFGVAFILAARHLSRKHEATVNNHLRETIQYYLAHTSHFSDSVDDESGAPGRVKRRGLSEERPILGQITGSRSFEANSSVRKAKHELHESAASCASDMKSLFPRYKCGNSLSDTSTGTQKVIHHTMDMGWLSRRYESASTAVAHFSWTTASGAVEGVTHHSVNSALLSQHYGTGSVGKTEAEFHATNTAHLRRDGGAAATHTTVHKALLDNNHYYDMLSRRNVIGGY